MFIAGCKKVCCYVVKLISFELWEPNAVKMPILKNTLVIFIYPAKYRG